MFIWKITRNLLYYGLVVGIIAGGAYTGVIGSLYSIFLGLYGDIASFWGVMFANLVFGVIGILIIFSVIGIFYQKN